MKIVVTGAFGFIGSHFVKWVFNLDEDIEILVIDNCTYAADKSNLNINIELSSACIHSLTF